MAELIKPFEPGRSLQSDHPLTDDEIREVAPSIFAEEPHESCSDRYTHIPTSRVLAALRREGFEPFFCAQSGSRSGDGSHFAQHMLRLRHRNQTAGGEAQEIVLINSHDGSTAYQMLAGLFRFVCSNGIVTGDTIGDLRVLHRGDVVDRVVESAHHILSDFTRVSEALDGMKSTTVTREEREAFGKAALLLRYDDPAKAPISPAQVVTPRRHEDTPADLWTTLNVAQENLVRGGVRGRNAAGKRVTTRPLQAIDRMTGLNRAIWSLTEAFRRLKNGEEIPA